MGTQLNEQEYPPVYYYSKINLNQSIVLPLKPNEGKVKSGNAMTFVHGKHMPSTNSQVNTIAATASHTAAKILHQLKKRKPENRIKELKSEVKAIDSVAKRKRASPKAGREYDSVSLISLPSSLTFRPPPS